MYAQGGWGKHKELPRTPPKLQSESPTMFDVVDILMNVLSLSMNICRYIHTY